MNRFVHPHVQIRRCNSMSCISVDNYSTKSPSNSTRSNRWSWSMFFFDGIIWADHICSRLRAVVVELTEKKTAVSQKKIQDSILFDQEGKWLCSYQEHQSLLSCKLEDGQVKLFRAYMRPSWNFHIRSLNKYVASGRVLQLGLKTSRWRNK